MTFKRFVNAIEILALVLAGVFVVLLFVNEPDGGGTASGSPGAQIFQANCASCHGADGGGGIGPELANGAVVRAFPDEAKQVAVVTNGRDGMPSFDGDLTGDEIQQVVEYTRTDLGG
jgi:mono/diheme cytochrome c family protein